MVNDLSDSEPFILPETAVLNACQGVVQRYHSNFYYVRHPLGMLECFLKGLLKKEGVDVRVGDWVLLDSLDEANLTARITGVQPAKNVLTRPKVANVDQVVVVAALQDPLFDFTQLDRFLTHIQLSGLEAILCITKTDLRSPPSEDSAQQPEAVLQQIQALYAEQLGFSVFYTTIHQPDSFLSVRERLQNSISVLTGVSGVGKSELIRQLNPALDVKIGTVSEKSLRGTHTTRHVALLEINPTTYIADTPGFSHLSFETVLPEQLVTAFPEFEALKGHCTFSDCLHLEEEGCCVQQGGQLLFDAVSESTGLPPVSVARYKSYQEFMVEARRYKEHCQQISLKEVFGKKTLHRKGQENIEILRLKEKNRELSRRRVRQATSTELLDDDEADTILEQ
jgi:ribosome biogenesis GTPase / thiamine phosphate phosphatase